jgi:hypothetical protein
MIKKLFLSVLPLLLQWQAMCQNTYERYSAVSQNSELIMHLIKTDKQFSGVLYKNGLAGFSRTDLSGSMDEGGEIRFQAMGNDEGNYTGKLAATNLLLTDAEGRSWELMPSYPSGSLQLAYHYLKATRSLDPDNLFSPKANVETGILLPRASTPAVMAEFARYYRMPRLLDSDAHAAIAEDHNRFFDQYVQMNTNIDQANAALNWERTHQPQVLLNEKGLLSIEKASYAYTGDAHGLTHMQYMLLDIKTAKVLGLSDIINDDQVKSLTALLNQKIRERYAIASGQLLTEAGFFVDEVKPTDNIYVTLNGIGFYYNSYEIAPYAFGHTNVFVSFDEIGNLLKQNTAVFGLVSNE